MKRGRICRKWFSRSIAGPMHEIKEEQDSALFSRNQRRHQKMGLIWNLILGAIAGFIATGIMHENKSWIKNILLGIVGGFVGGLVFRLV
jgi:hypothetical protein